ncbi:hypothetical protein PI124_g3110 [Phytophthora idaei]|nr:hypothetical protein PI124_g3110 [Phytophthora idaei]
MSARHSQLPTAQLENSTVLETGTDRHPTAAVGRQQTRPAPWSEHGRPGSTHLEPHARAAEYRRTGRDRHDRLARRRSRLHGPKGDLPEDKRHILNNVKWIQATYAGVDMYLDLLPKGPDAVLPKFTLSRAGGMMPRIMAQYVLGYVTMIERKLLEAKEYQSKRDYARVDMISFRPAQSVTVGILGLGDIGQYTGKMLRSCGYNVLGFKRRVSAQDVADLAECADHVTTSLEEVLAKSDYLINLLPSTSATRYVLNETNLELCREHSPVFINIGRGDVISEKTLIDALNKGTLSKAVLDVFEKEPLPKESGLWEHPSVLLTPHVSGKVFPEDVAAMFLNNFNRYTKGEVVRYKVDWAKGY